MLPLPLAGVAPSSSTAYPLEAVLSSYLAIQFFRAESRPFFTRTNTFFDGLLFFFCPGQERIQQIAKLYFLFGRKLWQLFEDFLTAHRI
jgi:hypothetical protein